jgi:hypothetical protein
MTPPTELVVREAVDDDSDAAAASQIARDLVETRSVPRRLFRVGAYRPTRTTTSDVATAAR